MCPTPPHPTRVPGFPADAAGLKLGKYHHLGGSTTADSLDRRVHATDEAALRQARPGRRVAAGGRWWCCCPAN